MRRAAAEVMGEEALPKRKAWRGWAGGAAGVGRGVNDTVVQSVLAIFAANYLLSSLFRVLG